MRKAWVLVLVMLSSSCGPSSNPPSTPTTTPSSPGASPSSFSTSTTGPAASGTAAAVPPVPSGSGSAPTSKPPMRGIEPTKMADALREIGVDPNALPALNKLDPDKLRKVMKTFTQSLGVQCSHCHEKDFKAPTRNKKIATHMWNDFARGLVVSEGPASLYCDSCHNGKPTFLDRTDVPAISQYMTENYEAKLARVDKAKHGCATCHGDPFAGKIFAGKWQIK